MSHAYDSDEGRHSPGLEPIKPNYGFEEPLPPFLRNSQGKGRSPDTSGIARGTAVLVEHLDKNRPDLRDYELHNHLKRELTPEDKEFPKPQDTAMKALQLLQNDPPKDNAPKNDLLGPAKEPRNEQGLPQLLPPLPSMPSFREPYKQTTGPGPLTHGLLPAIHHSPTAFSKPPDNHSLPPIQSALGELPNVPLKDSRVTTAPCQFPPVAAPSPRNESIFGPPPQAPLSPYSHLSPASSKDISNMPSPVSQPSYQKSHKSTIHYVTSPNEIPPQAAKSPLTSYPTPTDPPTVGSLERGYADPSTPLNGTAATGNFRCSYPGCTAPPFPTQYLLNSHANVHSQDRPHFCPVEGCLRGPGGKGFKRKNEMIRHGLVHNSPGYICPFCPGQQHRYPRPDNLQRWAFFFMHPGLIELSRLPWLKIGKKLTGNRHVRVHHVDKGKDDPELRRVLSLRPEGSSRKRRQKINNY